MGASCAGIFSHSWSLDAAHPPVRPQPYATPGRMAANIGCPRRQSVVVNLQSPTVGWLTDAPVDQYNAATDLASAPVANVEVHPVKRSFGLW